MSRFVYTCGMRVLGFDPGLRITGYGCVSGSEISAAIMEASAVQLVP